MSGKHVDRITPGDICIERDGENDLFGCFHACRTEGVFVVVGQCEPVAVYDVITLLDTVVSVFFACIYLGIQVYVCQQRLCRPFVHPSVKISALFFT